MLASTSPHEFCIPRTQPWPDPHEVGAKLGGVAPTISGFVVVVVVVVAIVQHSGHMARAVHVTRAHCDYIHVGTLAT